MGARTSVTPVLQRPRPPPILPALCPCACLLACRPAPQQQLPQPAAFPSHHRTPFGGLAALLAGALDRAQQGGATYAHVDVLLPGEARQQPVTQKPPQQQPAAEQQVQQPALHPAQQPVLLLQDDGPGLTPQQLRRSLGVPSWAYIGAGPIAAAAGGSRRSDSGASSGSEGSAAPGGSLRDTDCQHAVLRLGSAALLLTKRRGQGASAGLLSCASGAGGGAEVLAAAVDWTADGSWCPAATPDTGGAAAAATDPTAAWQSALNVICARWPGGASEAWLQQQLGAMPEQGTRLLVVQLRHASSGSGSAAAQGGYELDWTSDPADIQLAAAQPGSSASGVAAMEAGLPGVLAGGSAGHAMPCRGACQRRTSADSLALPRCCCQSWHQPSWHR